MRDVGSISNHLPAERFSNYLESLGIRVRLEEKPAGWSVWIYEEEQVPSARRELQTFLEEPEHQRYRDLDDAVRAVRHEAARRQREYVKNVVDVRSIWDGSHARSRAKCTLAVCVVCVMIAVANSFGQKPIGSDRLTNSLLITEISQDDQGRIGYRPGLLEIRQGQVWRLITTAFAHFGIAHLVFNVFAMYNLGLVIEVRRGTWRLIALMLATGIPSHLAQYAVTGPYFAGLSGVLYGLFGYSWMKSAFDRAAGIFVPPGMVFMMMAWFALCWTGAVGNIANVAHGAGLGAGIVIGWVGTWCRRHFG
jgi:GlpG protein